MHFMCRNADLYSRLMFILYATGSNRCAAGTTVNVTVTTTTNSVENRRTRFNYSGNVMMYEGFYLSS